MRIIQKIAKNFSGLTALTSELRNHYGLRVIPSSFGGPRIIHVSRSPDTTPVTSETNEANPVIINNDLKVIAIGLPKVHQLSSPYSRIAFNDGMASITVEKMYKGIKVIVSKDNEKPIICTKDDPHGCNVLPKTSLSPYVLFSFLLDQSYGNLLTLFSKPNHYDELSWEFMIVQKEFMPPDSKLSYELFLIGATHKGTTTQLPSVRLDYIADSLGIKRPDREKVASLDEVNSLFKKWTLNDSTVRGVVITDSGKNTASILTRKTSTRFRGYCKSPGRHNMLKLLELIMKGEEQKAITFDPRYKVLVNSMKHIFKQLSIELIALQNTYGKARTRRHLAEKIAKHELAIVLFALHSQKINSLKHMSDILKPHYLLRVMEKRDRLRLTGATNLSKGILCQKKL